MKIFFSKIVSERGFSDKLSEFSIFLAWPAILDIYGHGLLSLITMSAFAACSVAHAEYELSEEDEGSVAVDSCVRLFETRGSLVAVTAVSCIWESWITFSTALFSSLPATETRSLQL